MDKLNLFEVNTKRCSKCKKIKSLNDFYKDKRNLDGLYVFCKKCFLKINKKSYIKYKDKKNKYGREYRKSKRGKKWIKEYLKRTQEKRSRQTKEYRIKHDKEIKEQRKRYRILNKKIIQERNYQYVKNRYKKDIKYRFKKNVSCLIRFYLKKRLSSKNSKSTFSFLPYTIDDLIKHLESLFLPWMNWQNYGHGKGKWTIDHIRPDSSFNYKSVEDEEFQKCWALENLRPMEFIENVIKSDKII